MSEQLTYQKFMGQRHCLGEILPLEMPLSIQIQVTNLCNFKCFYCSASQPVDQRRDDGILMHHMPLEDYKRCLDGIKQGGGTKALNLVGWGEPLLHPHIVEMVRYAKEISAAEVVRIVSNGSLLTHEMSDALISAGLDNIRISLQGTSAADYRQTSGVAIDFPQLVENITYYYKHKEQSTITLKIMDIAIAGKESEFERIFTDICDEYMIDSLIETSEHIDFSGHGSHLNKAFLGGDFVDSKICSVPFYRGFIDVDSRLIPCCHLPMSLKFGDVRGDFLAVWNGKEHIQFLLDLVSGLKDKYSGCRDCKMQLNQLLPSDRLDDYQDELMRKYQSLLTEQ